jgi:hypothetical protein
MERVMTLARAVKEELQGEFLGLLDRASIAVKVIAYAPTLWHVQVFAPGEFYWLSDNLQTEERAREAERAALKVVNGGSRRRNRRTHDWRRSL